MEVRQLGHCRARLSHLTQLAEGGEGTPRFVHDGAPSALPPSPETANRSVVRAQWRAFPVPSFLRAAPRHNHQPANCIGRGRGPKGNPIWHLSTKQDGRTREGEEASAPGAILNLRVHS